MNLRQVQIIGIALASGLIMISAVLGGFAFANVTQPQPALLAPLAGVVALALPVSVLAGIAIKSSIYQQARLAWLRQNKDAANNPVEHFENAYTMAALLQMAMLEGLGVLGAACVLITGEMLFLAAPLAAIVGMGLVFPSEGKFQGMIDQLSRPPEERELRLLEAQRER